MERVLVTGSLIVAALLPRFGWATNAPAVIHAAFEGAAHEAVHFEVFHKLSGKKVSAAIPAGNSRILCAKVLEGLLLQAGEAKTLRTGWHVSFPDRVMITRTGAGCPFSAHPPAYAPKLLNFTSGVANSWSGGDSQKHSVYNAIPEECHYVSHRTWVASSSPNVPHDGDAYDQGRWKYAVEVLRFPAGSVFGIRSSTTAGPKDTYGPNIWVHIQTEVRISCLAP